MTIATGEPINPNSVTITIPPQPRPPVLTNGSLAHYVASHPKQVTGESLTVKDMAQAMMLGQLVAEPSRIESVATKKPNAALRRRRKLIAGKLRVVDGVLVGACPAPILLFNPE